MWQLVPMEKNSSVPPYLLQSSISQERVGAGRCYTREISCWGDLTWHVEETSEALKEAPSIFSQDNSTAWESQWILFFFPFWYSRIQSVTISVFSTLRNWYLLQYRANRPR